MILTFSTFALRLCPFTRIQSISKPTRSFCNHHSRPHPTVYAPHPRFTLLATTLSSIAAVSILPSPASTAVITINDPTAGHTVAARHSGHEQAVADATDDHLGHVRTPAGDKDGGNATCPGKKPPESKARKSGGEPKQRTHKLTFSLPAALDKTGKKALAKESSGGEGNEHGSRKQKHMKASVRVHIIYNFVLRC